MKFIKLLNSSWPVNIVFWLILLTPLVYIPTIMFPATFGKGLWFFSFNVIFLALSLFTINFSSFRKVFKHFLTWSIIIMFIVASLSTIFSQNQFMSFWGPDGRLGGLLTMINALVLFGLVAAQIRAKEALRILGAIVVINFLVGLYTIAQMLDLPFTAVLGESARITATFGNPLFLGSFLVLAAPFTLYFIFASQKVSQKIFYSICFLVQVTALILTASRGPMLGFLVGMGIFAIGYLLIKYRNNYKRFWTILIGLFISLIIIASGLYLIRDQLGIRHLFHFSLSSGSIQQRFVLYDSIWKSVKERPWLGYGLENVYIAYDKYHNPILDEGGHKESFTTRAHNLFLDQLASSGFVGLLALLIFILSVLGVIINWLRKSDPGPKKVLALTFLAAAAAYFVQDLTLFETITIYVYGPILVALLLTLAARDTQSSLSNISKASPWQYLMAMPIFILSLILIINIYYPAFHNSALAKQAFWAQNHAKFSVADDGYNQIINGRSSPWDHFLFRKNYSGFILEYALNLARSGNKNEAVQLLERGINKTDELAEKTPLDIQIQLSQASLYTVLDYVEAIGGTQGDELFNQLMEKHPNRINLLVDWGMVLFLTARDQEAYTKLSQAVSFETAPSTAHFWFAVVNYYVGGDRDSTLNNLKLAVTKDIGRLSDNVVLEFAVSFLTEEGDITTAIAYEELLNKLYPENPKYLIGLAILYKSIGQVQKAHGLAEQTIKQFPDMSQEYLRIAKSILFN